MTFSEVQSMMLTRILAILRTKRRGKYNQSHEKTGYKICACQNCISCSSSMGLLMHLYSIELKLCIRQKEKHSIHTYSFYFIFYADFACNITQKILDRFKKA